MLPSSRVLEGQGIKGVGVWQGCCFEGQVQVLELRQSLVDFI